MSEWYDHGIEHSPYPPPMLESEKSITQKVTIWGDRNRSWKKFSFFWKKKNSNQTFNNRCMIIGGLVSSLAVYNRCGQMKKIFTKLGLPAWQVGPISVIGPGFSTWLVWKVIICRYVNPSKIGACSYGAKYIHYQLYSPQVFAELPEGYYREVYVKQMEYMGSNLPFLLDLSNFYWLVLSLVLIL